MNEVTLKEMRTKHPEADLPKLTSGSIPQAVRFDVDLVRKKVEGFLTGSAAGASVTRTQFFKDILSCSNTVAGMVPRELAPFIAGAPLMALVKHRRNHSSTCFEVLL